MKISNTFDLKVEIWKKGLQTKLQYYKLNYSFNAFLFLFLDLISQNLHKQLEEAIQDGEIWVMQLKDTEYELEGSRDRVQQQATEILHKASEILNLHLAWEFG